MKIYGTAKGGAISKKDFGVAFGGGGGLDPIDDTGLVCYYKFDESSTSVPNSSQSSESGGSKFDATANGATVGVSGHYGDCFSFDGVDDYMQTDDTGGTTSYSMWNFLKSGDSFSMTYWFRQTTTDNGRLWDQAYNGGGTLANSTTNFVGASDAGNGEMMVTNNTAARPLDFGYTNSYYYGTDWHFYCHMYNSASTSITSLMDNANSTTSNKTAAAFTSDNATTDMTFFRTVGSGQELAGEVQGWTFWNVLIDSDQIDALWNGGAGRSFY